MLFYQSVEDEQYLDKAVQVFEQLSDSSAYSGRATVYLGALTALRGKHAFLPHNKLKWVNRGLELMDKGLEQSPNDAEALFIHSSTCYYLPFFFNRDEQAQSFFKRIIKVLPDQWQSYDQSLLLNMLNFIVEHGKLSEPELDQIATLINEISNAS